jgi:hypothetical protein
MDGLLQENGLWDGSEFAVSGAQADPDCQLASTCRKPPDDGDSFMNETLRGVIRGRTIDLTEDSGLVDGQQVEITIKAVTRPALWGEGIRRCAGAFAADWTEEDDRIMLEIHQERKRDTRRESTE